MSQQKLAIYGGTPYRRSLMPPREAFGTSERKNLNNALQYYKKKELDPGYQGFFEEKYCALFRKFMGGGYADCVATGTAALYTAIAALQLPEGSEIIVSPITDPGTISAIILNKHIPKIADTSPGSYNMGVSEFVSRVTKKTAAVLVVHAAGRAARISEIVKEAKKRNLSVIEDCSQSHGAIHRRKKIGTFGTIAAFSTMYRKAHMTGPTGGIVYSKKRNLHNLFRSYADRGKPYGYKDFDDRDPNQFLFPALNLHLNELSCAIGCASLSRLQSTIRKRQRFVFALSKAMIESPAINCCCPYLFTKEDSPFFFPIFVNHSRIKCKKSDFAKALLHEGIPLNPHYQYVVSNWPWVQKFLADRFIPKNALKTVSDSFNIYLNENYGNREVRDIVGAIAKVENYFMLKKK